MLPHLPALDAAFAAGAIGWTKARELVGVVTPETEAAWVERAARVSSRELERLVKVTHVGSPPPGDVGPEKGPERVRLVYEVEASDAQVVRDLIGVLRAQCGIQAGELSDGALLAMAARRLLHDAPDDVAPSGERYRVVLESCPTCGTTCGRDHEASETVALEAACDAEVVDLRPGPDEGRLSRTIPPTVRRVVLHRDRERCRVPGCRCRLWIDLHHVRERHRGGRHVRGNLVTLCSAHHRLVHEGRLAIAGDADGVLAFETADGRVVRSDGRPTWVAEGRAKTTSASSLGHASDLRGVGPRTAEDVMGVEAGDRM
jgi:hypothetical protein